MLRWKSVSFPSDSAGVTPPRTNSGADMGKSSPFLPVFHVAAAAESWQPACCLTCATSCSPDSQAYPKESSSAPFPAGGWTQPLPAAPQWAARYPNPVTLHRNPCEATRARKGTGESSLPGARPKESCSCEGEKGTRTSHCHFHLWSPLPCAAFPLQICAVKLSWLCSLLQQPRKWCSARATAGVLSVLEVSVCPTAMALSQHSSTGNLPGKRSAAAVLNQAWCSAAAGRSCPCSFSTTFAVYLH